MRQLIATLVIICLPWPASIGNAVAPLSLAKTNAVVTQPMSEAPSLFDNGIKLLTLIGALTTVIYAARQFKLASENRRKESVIRLLGSAAEHNGRMLDRSQYRIRRAIAYLEKLTPTESIDEEEYWAVRLVHHAHLVMVWQVWELSKRPDACGSLGPGYDGWERFAAHVIAEPMRTASKAFSDGSKNPAMLAGADIWYALDRYEIFPLRFVEWLRSLPKDSASKTC
jgi:hypothetical protein